MENNINYLNYIQIFTNAKKKNLAKITQRAYTHTKIRQITHMIFLPKLLQYFVSYLVPDSELSGI